jgi:6-phosphogluconolactonase/glucosamine-6-phosphate isomerase/deaminase
LSGGNSPKAMCQILGCIPWIEQIDWEIIRIFWGDERDVNPDEPESNYRVAREPLLMHVPIHDKNIHRIFSELGAHDAATSYERTLRLYFDSEYPRFDLIFLGMGGRWTRSLTFSTHKFFARNHTMGDTKLSQAEKYLAGNIGRASDQCC